MQFSEYLKSCRENNDLTQEQLVHDLYSYDLESFKSLDANTLSKWERSVTKPKTSKQLSIMKYFQEQSGMALPCWDHYSIKDAENLICKAGMQNLIGKSEQLILNFPSEMMSVDDMKVSPIRNFEETEALIQIHMDQHRAVNPQFTQIDIEQLKEWSLHPNNLFLVCQYKGWFRGLFFSIRLKQEVFDKLLNFQMKKSDITIEDFASFDEMGCNYMLSLHAINEKVATMLLIRYYAHLIANQKSISEIGVVTSLDEVKKAVSNMNLHYHKSKIINDNIEIQAYRETLFKVLASENIVKMILSKQECPEE